jgi:DNA polymerase elongation subunit (family B)
MKTLLPLPLTDPRFPGLRLRKANPSAKKTDPDYRDRIVSDDSVFDIFTVPDLSLISKAKITLYGIAPFEEYSKGVAFLDCEWVGGDGGSAKGDGSDVLVAIGLKFRGRYCTACNKTKSEKELLNWFFTQLENLSPHTIAGFTIYGFYRGDFAVPVDLGMIYCRSLYHGIKEKCPWSPKDGDFPSRRWNNAIVFGKPLEVPAWECKRYQLIDLYPQLVLYDSLIRKLDNYKLKDSVISLGLRSDRRIEIGSQVYEYWNRGDTSSIVEYLKLDLDDTELLWKFLIPQKYFMRSYMDISLESITLTGSGSWWNRYLKEKSDAYPQPTATCGYKGALTFYHAGVYRDCAKFDFSGLYPSIMITWLICSHKDENQISLKTLSFLIKYRKQIKDSKEFKDGSIDADGQQHTAKILANSLYGLWNTSGVGFNDPYAGAAVCAYGRNLARYMISWLHDRGVETIALDTDGALCRFKNDTFTDSERDAEFQKLSQELNENLPGLTSVEYEAIIPFLWVPPNSKDTYRASINLAEKLNSIGCYENVQPDQLDPGLSKNYLYFSKNKDGSYKLNKKGKFKKRDKSWLASGFVIEVITKLFYNGEPAAIAYIDEVRDAIESGSLPVEKLQKTVLVAANWKEFPLYGFPVGSKPTIHYAWRGDFEGVRKRKKKFVPTDDAAEPYVVEYYLELFDEIVRELPIRIKYCDDQLTLI